MQNIPESIKWRGSTYIMERVEEGNVYWYNPVSRHRESCTVESWVKYSDPYNAKYS